MSAQPPAERAYPLPRPESGGDPRFSMGLLADVARVIRDHGYPPVTAGGDLADLQQALFGFLYGTGRRVVAPDRHTR